MNPAQILHTGCLVLCISALAPLGATQDGGAPAPIQRPRYQVLPQNEDWSTLRDEDRARTDDFWDRIKFMPLDAEGTRWLTLGGQARMRGEFWRGASFGQVPAGASADDELLLWRFLLHADLHLSRDLRLFFQGKSALLSDRELPGGKRTLDEDRADVQQLFADVSLGDPGDTRFTLRPGRAALSFGKQRLVSPLDWSNTLRAWDGVQGILTREDWKFTGFWTRFVLVDARDFNEADDDNQFFGLYAEQPRSGSRAGLDVYYLGLQNERATFNSTTGGEERHTVGARTHGRLGEGPWDYDIEGAYQFGRVGAGDVSAWMVGAELGRTFPEQKGKPRAWLGLDHGSGDGSAGGDVGTFNQLYPLGHAYLGYIDTVGRQNIWDASLGLGFTPSKDTYVTLIHHAFWLADTSDALYNAGGGIVRAGGTADSNWVGNELDLRVTRNFGRHTTLLAGASRFFAGDAIRQSGRDDDVDFVYLTLQYTF